MKQVITKLSQVVIAGFFLLFPMYVVFIVLSKAWMSLTSIGTRLAALFGVKTVLGVGGHQLLTGLLIIFIWLLCGLLVRVSFIGALSRAMAGLGLGSWASGKWFDKAGANSAFPALRLYGVIELLIGVSGLVVPPVLIAGHHLLENYGPSGSLGFYVAAGLWVGFTLVP